MATRVETGMVGEKKAIDYLINKGFEIVETNCGRPCHFFDVLIRKDGILYVVNVKYTPSEIGTFGIGLANLKHLIKYSHEVNARIMLLFIYKDNIASFLLNPFFSSWQDVSRAAKRQHRIHTKRQPIIRSPCRRCNRTAFHKKGTYVCSRGVFQIYQCNACGTCVVSDSKLSALSLF